MAGVDGQAPAVVQINKLKFTYPGIDGAPPPGAKPLIEDFSLTLRAGERCLLVGANGAGKADLLLLYIQFFGAVLCRIHVFETFDFGLGASCGLGFEIALGSEVLEQGVRFRVQDSDPCTCAVGNSSNTVGS